MGSLAHLTGWRRGVWLAALQMSTNIGALFAMLIVVMFPGWS